MPRAAAPKKATAAKPKKPKAKKATAKKVAAPRRRVTLQPSSGETLKQNATQLEVAERMLAELASREQAETDPAVAAQRALRAAIASGAIPAGATILKSAPKIPSQNDMEAQARLDAQKAAAKAARDTAKAQANAREWEAMWRRAGGPAPPVIALGAPVMGGPIPAPAPPPMPPPIMPPTGPPVPPPPPPRAPPVATPARAVVTANALNAAMRRLHATNPPPRPNPAQAKSGPQHFAALAAERANRRNQGFDPEEAAAVHEARQVARRAEQQAAASQQRVLENELVAAVSRREDARAAERAQATTAANNLAIQQMVDSSFSNIGGPRPLALPVESPAANNLAIQQMVDSAFSNIGGPRPLALPVESPAATASPLSERQRANIAETNRAVAAAKDTLAAEIDRLRAAITSREAGPAGIPAASELPLPSPVTNLRDVSPLPELPLPNPITRLIDGPRPPRVVSFGTQTGDTGPRPALGDNIIVYNRAGDAISSYKSDSAPLRDRIARGDIYQDVETGQYVWSAGAVIPPQTRLRPVNNPAQSVVDIVSRELEGAGLYGYGDTPPPRPRTTASKSGRRVIPGYSHAETMSTLRNLITKVNEEADIAARAAQRDRERIAVLRAYQPKTSATIATQTDPMVPTMTVFNSRTMEPYTVSMATYQKNYNAGNIEMDESGRPIFVVKAHRDANKMIADQEMNDYINELIAEMPDTEGAGRGGETHAVGFPSDEWTPAQARKWVKDHGGKPIKPMRREGSWLRFRMTPPDRYSRFATKTLKSNGRTVHLVIGWR